MKTWGLSKGEALLGVLLILMSALIVLPQTAKADGKEIYGNIFDCVNSIPVGATVTLVDPHALLPERSESADPDSGYFAFPNPPPSYYKLVIKPSGYTNFSKETAPFRFDGTIHLDESTCVDPMPAKSSALTITVIDAQAASTTEAVTFAEFDRAPENITGGSEQDYDYLAANVSLDAWPLGWLSEKLVFSNATTPIGGVQLVRSVDYTYTTSDAVSGKIHILNTTIQNELRNTVFRQQPSGWLEVTYQNVSTSARLSHTQISGASFLKNGFALSPPWSTLTLDNESGHIQINISSGWKFGSLGDNLTATYDWSGTIQGAQVTVRYAPQDQAISDPVATNTAGKASFMAWDATFEVIVTKDTYQPAQVNVAVVGTTNRTIPLSKGYTVRATARAAEGGSITDAQGLTGVLINPLGPTQIRVLSPNVNQNSVVFYAYNGTWTLFIDANGRKADVRTVVVNGANLPPFTVVLQTSPPEQLATEVRFAGPDDWNNLTVSWTWTLLPDSAFPGVGFANIPDIRRQLDLKFGDGNGVFDAAEQVVFTNYLGSAGPLYAVTDDFFTVNGKAYNSTGFVVSPPSVPASGNVTITASATYQLKDMSKPIAANKPRYFVNVTTMADKNVTVYQNNSYLIRLPRTYEMTSRTTVGNVDTKDFVNITVDPKVDAVVPNPRVNMIVEKSLTGVARAEVEGPAGKVSVREADQAYLAWVANDTAIVFSANKTTDRSNQAVNVKDANFTWRFTNGTLPGDVGWGIWSTFNYTNNGGEFTVNLTVTQVNPTNVTWRDIKVVVDNADPIANIQTNKTAWTLNPNQVTPYSINEDQPIRFFGNASTDLLYGTTAGEVAEWSWDFDSDGTVDDTRSIVTWNYSKPGTYNATLFVKDFVGHRSANRTMQFTVKDVTPPVIDFVIIDPNNEFREVTTLSEGKDYIFNASKTTDNSLNHSWDNVNLTYRWQWGDGADTPPSTGSNASLNVTHPYERFSSTGYKLNLTVTDAAGKNATLTRTIIVQANVTAHPDVSIITNTLKISPTPSGSEPQEGSKVTFTLNITNALNKANATDLKVVFAVVERGKDENQTVTVAYIQDGNRVQDPTLQAGKNLTVEIVWTALSPPANYSVKITVSDGDEPSTWITDANRQLTSVVVREAGWKFWAIVGAFVFIVFGLPIIYYIVRKVRAGEISLRRRGRDEDEEEEEEEEEEEDEDEDEDTGGKKRL